VPNFAYQVTNHAYQGDGQFAYQGSSGGVVPVVIPPGGTSRKKRFKARKQFKPEVPRGTNEIVVELIPPVNTFALQQVLEEMNRAGFDIKEQEEEDDVLVLTFIMKSLQ
jgi:hypothetical protein